MFFDVHNLTLNGHLYLTRIKLGVNQKTDTKRISVEEIINHYRHNSQHN